MAAQFTTGTFIFVNPGPFWSIEPSSIRFGSIRVHFGASSLFWSIESRLIYRVVFEMIGLSGVMKGHIKGSQKMMTFGI